MTPEDLTDVEGLRSEVDDPHSLIRRATLGHLAAKDVDGDVDGCMKPKIEACIHSV